MNTVRLLLIILIVALSPAAAQDAKVRASLGTKEEVWVGQRITLVVELLAPGYFASAASFQLPDPAGMVLIPPSGSPVVSSETIDDVSYTVQRHELSVFARRGGPQTIPPLTARFQFKRQPLDKDSVTATVKTESLQFECKIPPGAEKLGGVISARNLTAIESWKPEPGKAKAGEAFTRTITFSAPEVPAMAFPPFPAGKLDGLGIYPKPPEVLDRSERGDLTGERRDTIVYLCQRAGSFTIPAAQLTWFDLDAKKLQTIEFPARTFDVAPNPAMASAAAASSSAAQSTTSGLPDFLSALAVAVVLSVLLILLVRWTALWQRLAAIFRPIHLAPLNPPGEQRGNQKA